MTQDQLSQLFQEGVQFDVNKLQHGGGSGLGLYITKGLIEQHGGKISVHSDGPNLGTTFTFELPLYRFPSPLPKSAINEREESTASVSSTTATEMGEKTRRLLVVDDVAANCKMLVRLLERCGHTFATAFNGREAIDAFMKDASLADEFPDHVPFDTVLLDYEMPVCEQRIWCRSIDADGL